MTFFENFIAKIKEIYFAMEDRYYDFLDTVNKYIPIYKIIDPIDRVFPSFILFLLLSLIVFILLVFFIFSLFQTPAFTSTIQVVDFSNNPIEGITVTGLIQEKEFSDTTDSNGTITVLLPEKEVIVSIIIPEQNDFLEKTVEASLKANETFKIILERKPISSAGSKIGEFSGKTFTLYFVDASTDMPITEQVRVSFVCSNSVSSIADKYTTSGELKLRPEERPSDCSSITATATSANYLSETKTLTTQIVTFRMTPTYVDDDTKDQLTGVIIVNVTEYSGDPVVNATVNLTDISTNALVNSGVTQEDGSIQFDSVHPGDYKVLVLTTDGRSLNSDVFHLDQSETKYIDLAFSVDNPQCTTEVCLSNQKKVFLQLKDEETSNVLSGITVRILKNNAFLVNLTSNSEGIVEQVLQDTSTNVVYAAIIEDPNYVTKIINPLTLVSASTTTPIEVLLTPSTAETTATITVKVIDEQNKPIKNAKVWLYTSSNVIVNNPSGDLTNQQGEVKIQNLVAGTYYAIAKSPDEEKSATSSNVSIAEGEEKTITLTLVLGKGKIEVTVKDSQTKDLLANATAEFYDVTNDVLLATCITASNGKCTSPDISADKVVYVVVSAEEYMTTTYEDEVHIVKDSTARITVELQPEDSSAEPLLIRFERLCTNESCTSITTKIESAPDVVRQYYLKFSVVLSQQMNYSDIIAHVHVGNENEYILPSTDYKVRLDYVKTSVPDNSVFLSTCYDPSNPFSNPSGQSCQLISNTNDGARAKQVNINFGSISNPTTFSFTVQIEIEPGLSNGTPIEVRYAAKATTSNNQLRDPSSNFKLLNFPIGEESCLFSSDEPLALDLSMNIHGEEVVLATDATHRLDLNKDEEYELYYSVFNCSDESMNIAMTIEPKSLLLNDSEETLTAFQQQIASGQKIVNDSNPIRVKGTLVTDTAQLTFNLKPSANASESYLERTEYFKVKPLGSLSIEELSTIVVPPYTQTVSGVVRTAGDNPQGVSDAHVSLFLNDSTTPYSTLDTDRDGRFSFSNIDFRGISSALLKAEHAGFNPDTENLTINVTPPDQTPFDYSCLSRNPNEVTIDKATQSLTSMTFASTNCKEPITVKLFSELSVSPTIFTLQENDTKTITVTASYNGDDDLAEVAQTVFQGEYGLFVSAKFDSDSTERPLRSLTTDIKIKNSAAECFLLLDPVDKDPNQYTLKSLYNINHRIDSGTIYNKCNVSIDSFTVQLLHKGIDIGLSTDSISFESSLSGSTTTSQTSIIEHSFLTNNEPFTLNASKPSIEFNIQENGSPIHVDYVDFLLDDNQSQNLKMKISYLSEEDVWQTIPENVNILTDSRLLYLEQITQQQEACLDENVQDINWHACVSNNIADFNNEIYCGANNLNAIAECLNISGETSNECFEACRSKCYNDDSCPGNCWADCNISFPTYIFLSIPVWQFRVLGRPQGLAVNATAKKLKLEITGFSNASTKESVNIFPSKALFTSPLPPLLLLPPEDGENAVDDDSDGSGDGHSGGGGPGIDNGSSSITEIVSLYAAKLLVETQAGGQQEDNYIDFNVSNNSLGGPYNYAFLKLKPVSGSGKNTEYFHVRLKAAEADNCVLDDGTIGFTGAQAMPAVIFDWSWKALPGDFCSQNYCDPTQFTIYLIKKFIASQNTNLEQLDFNVFLIEDYYTDTFKKDFDYYYTQKNFADTPTDYKQKWSKYLGNTDNDRFKFSVVGFQNNLALAGKYNVKINVVYDDPTNPKLFDSSNNPKAKITVLLSYLQPPVINSIFYRLPFNGLVGMKADGSIERVGYGLGFSYNNTDYIALSKGTQGLSLLPSSGAKAYNASVTRSFTSTNITNRWHILSISSDAIAFSPSKAIPIIASMNSNNLYSQNSISSFLAYSLYLGTQTPLTTSTSLNFWTAIASNISQNTKCLDFLNNPLFYNKADDGYDEPASAYGFSYSGIPQVNNNKKLFLHALLFIPENQQLIMNVEKINDTNAGVFQYIYVTPVGDYVLSNEFTSIEPSSLPNDSSSPAVYSLLQLLSGIQSGRICYTESDNETNFYFNPQYFERQVDGLEDYFSRNLPEYCFSGLKGAITS